METKTPIDNNEIHSICFNVAYKENQRRDADPICLVADNKRYGALAVFNGLGGAGSAVRNRVEIYLMINETKDGYYVDKDVLTGYLQDASQSNMLPTTMSMLLWQVDNDCVHISNLWTGDSRNYLLNRDGLAQLTTDYIRDGFIEESHYTVNYPVALYACTDSCFKYFDTPMTVEHIFNDAISRGKTIENIRANMINSIKEVAADNFSCSMAMIGLPEWAWSRELESGWKKTMQSLRRYWLYKKIQNLIPLRIQQTLEEYKTRYERIISNKS